MKTKNKQKKKRPAKRRYRVIVKPIATRDVDSAGCSLTRAVLKPLTPVDILKMFDAEKISFKLPSPEYKTADISDEMWREVYFVESGKAYRITEPKTLVIRKGGKTHRVIDKEGVVHCYAAPETGVTVLRWMGYAGTPAVRF